MSCVFPSRLILGELYMGKLFLNLSLRVAKFYQIPKYGMNWVMGGLALEVMIIQMRMIEFQGIIS